ncbi:MAG TPA: ABC transporter substrate-binding protein [Victivallales bacterium]|nr:ABC transporter substrate-binding protein [Victivallales bacterium]
MGRNAYQNIILSVFFVVFAIFALVQIRNVDLMRLRLEKLAEELKTIEGKISNLQTGTVISNATSPGLEKKSSAKIANVEFYDANAVAGGKITSAVSSETKNMNSLVNNEAFVSTVYSYAMDALTERNLEKPEVFEPKIAENWELSEDKLTYTVRIRKGVIWHDFKDPVSGKEWKDVEVTADDFAFYVEVVKNEDADCAPLRSYLQDLDRIEVIDKYSFKVVWRKKYFLSESITLGLEPLPRHLYHDYEGPFDGKKFNEDHERNRIIVGCGPYRFDRWEKGQRVVMKKWGKYYGKEYGVMPPLDEIVFEVIKHPNTQLQALKSGKIDRMGFTPDQWVNNTGGPEFEENSDLLKKYKYPSRSYSYIGYNLRMPLFSDKRVRRALTHLIDRERILKEIYNGLGRICSGPFFIDSPYYDSKIVPYEFSPSKAKSLLGEAGWKDSNGDGILDKDGKKFEFTILSVADHPIQMKMLPLIKEDMASAGIVMKISPVEWSVYVQRLENKNFEVCVLGWAMGFESDPYQIWHSSESEKAASSNHCGFVNPEADELIMKIRDCFDLDERIALCHRFHRLLHDEQPYTFLITPFSLLGQSARYRNVRVFSSGIETRTIWDGKQMRSQ